MTLWIYVLSAATYAVMWILVWKDKIPRSVMSFVHFMMIMAVVILGLIYLTKKIIGGDSWNG